jgi:hypothetical protein
VIHQDHGEPIKDRIEALLDEALDPRRIIALLREEQTLQ